VVCTWSYCQINRCQAQIVDVDSAGVFSFLQHPIIAKNKQANNFTKRLSAPHQMHIASPVAVFAAARPCRRRADQAAISANGERGACARVCHGSESRFFPHIMTRIYTYTCEAPIQLYFRDV
jgi:hypothetical protein